MPLISMRALRSMVLAGLLMGMAAVAAAADDARSVATRLLDLMDAGDYAGAEALFTPTMAAAVPASKLQSVWESLPAQLGPAQGRGAASVATQGGMQVVAIPLGYANGALVARIAVDVDGRIAGFVVQPAPPPAAAAPPAQAAYVEREVQVAVTGPLPATLAMPKGAGPFPAVVLVHGSGPLDRDETVGANRPFLDIARGLAARGIAVLRYEKRTRARPQDFASGHYTMDEETTMDAVAAVETLAHTPSVDPRRIFVLGHSQGGMLAPRIAARSGKVAGLILLAAPARPLLTLLPEQNRYLLGLDGELSAQDQAVLAELQRRIAAVRGPGDVPASDSPMGLPAEYWRAFEKVDPVADAKALARPMLLLQGRRDFQVVDADWTRWRAALEGDGRVTFLHYPSLNHLGISGQGPGSLAEYQTPGHVDATLIADVATWITSSPCCALRR